VLLVLRNRKASTLASLRAVDRTGCKNFRTKQAVKGLRPPKAALRALDSLFCSEATLAVAIDGFF
jgi:hypothetical protein